MIKSDRKDLDKVLNYMKQYVENKYEHDSEPMLNWKDLKIILDEIERLNKENERLRTELNGGKNIIKEVREYIKNIPDDEFVESEHFTELLEILDKENNNEDN